MLVKTLPVGPLEANCYIVSNEESLDCVVIDPGDESNTIMDYIEDNHLKCVAVMLTHGHRDHMGAADAVVEETGAPLYMHPADEKKEGAKYRLSYELPKNGKFFSDGDSVEAAGMKFDIIGTPGHTPGSVCIVCGDCVFTGDTLFRGTCGRADLPGGDMEQELKSLKKLCSLPGDYEVYPGHMEASSLERERMFNYYCRLAMENK